MPLIVVPCEKALDHLRSNPAARWPNRRDPDNRIEPIARPSFKQGFSMQPGSSIFTIGSCFARNVETALLERGFDVLVRRYWSRDETKQSVDNRMLDNYSVASICNELEWAIGGKEFIPDLHLCEVFPGLFSDLHLHFRVPLCSLEAAIARRARIVEATRSILRADAIIMTLGLAEVWWDRTAGIYLNTKPHDALCRLHPDRFELHILSYDDVMLFLKRTFDLILEHCHPDAHVLLTVSPVPLTATFTDQDVCVANQYSKSVLRAAASAVVQTYDRVTYFPAYESVVLSDRSRAWHDDMVHVHERLVEQNVRAMVAAYVPGSGPSGVEVPSREGATPPREIGPDLDAAQAFIRAREFQRAEALLEAALADLDLTPQQVCKCHRVLGRALMIQGRYEEAEERFRSVLRISYNDAGTRDYLGRVLMSQGRYGEALDAFEIALSCNPASKTAAAHLSTCLAQEGRPQEARAILDSALTIHPSDPGLLRLRGSDAMLG